MPDKSTLLDLFHHMEWSDATVWTALLASRAARDDEKLRGCLYHLHMVQQAFLRAWRGEPRETPYPQFQTVEPLMEWGRSYYPKLFAHWDALDGDKLEEEMPVPWAAMVERRIGRKPGPTTVAETALQAALHSLYHRGQVNARLREVGGTPPLVDYIAWLWLGRPGAVWPSTDGAGVGDPGGDAG